MNSLVGQPDCIDWIGVVAANVAIHTSCSRPFIWNHEIANVMSPYTQ